MRRTLGLIVAVVMPLLAYQPAATAATAPRTVPSPVRGVTLDDVSRLDETVTSFKNMSNMPTARIVFDEYVPATDYVTAVSRIRPYAYVMGEILDSYYVKQYSVAAYRNRVAEYQRRFGSQVDIWEIGNEVNGEWLGTTTSVVQKITDAYNQTKSRGLKSAVTLYYNPDCWSRASNEMFTWARTNISAAMKSGLDYVFVSYYEHDCENYAPTTAEWRTVFDRLHTMFPKSKIGFGEIGTAADAPDAAKAAYINRYYPMDVRTPGFVGGFFWWYYAEDMLRSQSLWSTLNTAMRAQRTTPL